MPLWKTHHHQTKNTQFYCFLQILLWKTPTWLKTVFTISFSCCCEEEKQKQKNMRLKTHNFYCFLLMLLWMKGWGWHGVSGLQTWLLMITDYGSTLRMITHGGVPHQCTEIRFPQLRIHRYQRCSPFVHMQNRNSSLIIYIIFCTPCLFMFIFS